MNETSFTSSKLQSSIDFWDQHVTPYSPRADDSIEARVIEDDEPFIGCSVVMRHARKLEFSPINSFTCWFSLPYKFVIKVVIPVHLLNRSPVNIAFALLRECDSSIVENGIEYELNFYCCYESKYHFEYKIYLKTSSHSHNRSKFRISIFEQGTSNQLYITDPKTILARKCKRTRKVVNKT